jgi:CBS domain-containing protein
VRSVTDPDAPAPPGDVEAFLAATPPFDALDPDRRLAAIGALTVHYARLGERPLRAGDPAAALFVVRRGAVELTAPDGDLVARLGEGGCFGHLSLLEGEPSTLDARTIEDTLYYALPAERFRALCAAESAFAAFFRDDARTRIARAVADRRATETGSTPVRDLLARPPATAPATTTAREAARLLGAADATALLVVEGTELRGIVTDRDLRRRVLAAGLDGDVPVARIMTPEPRTVTGEATVAEVLALMLEANVHHVPVRDGDRLLGVVHREDLLRAERDHPLHLLAAVEAARDRDALVSVGLRLPRLVVQLAEADALAEHTGRMVSAVTDGFTRRLIALAEEALGPAPAPWAWILLGSQGRREQLAGSDQDNALILADGLGEAEKRWFATFAESVCEGLAACGIRRCPGDVMAANRAWRMPVSDWQRTFRRWIDEPTPGALLHANIFFDLRHGAGDPALTRAVREEIRGRAPGSTLFLTLLTEQACRTPPPLGLFRRFVLERGGEHADTLDLKHRGVVPVVDLARIHALAAGVATTHTADRLRALAGDRLAPASAASLVDALEFVNHLRLRHQAARLRAGREPDNHLPPTDLSPLEQRQLHAAFTVMRDAQRSLANAYRLG